MERAVRTGARRDYASAVSDLWEGLGAALARLERIAEAAPDDVASEAGSDLPALQYHLHAGAELALGIQPPAGAQPVHAELVAALTHARDATAEIAAALEDADEDLVGRLLPEWRGALFRVRLARLRALERSPLEFRGGDAEAERAFETPRPDPGVVRAAVAATALVVAGAILFTAGAVLAAWPLWAAGLALFAGGFILFRP